MESSKLAGVRVMPAQDDDRQPRQSSISEARARQRNRIRELGDALAAAGVVTIDERARALALSRSTTAVVLKGNHKASGLAAATINQMLSSSKLPPRVRATILTYVEEKLAGLYGHNKAQLRRFAARRNLSDGNHSPGTDDKGESSGAFAKECRENAEECIQWARTAKTDREREIFLQIARSWMEAAQWLEPHASGHQAQIRYRD
jgi:hypothetical protein